ncbi:amino acid permease [Arthrobacter sp. NPDC058130]|uniref:amino acid permease n=1 Tax=Arthrobacter sp. NPDC058130 TaxID=3346353 RepID=UPI0036EB6DE1
MDSSPTLKKSLSQRQLTMIAMGGVIGAGLFVGSGVVISETGPGAFISYGITGVVIIMVMRMLAEMAVASPSTGSFTDYSRRALGDWAGFSVGWLYWYNWVVTVGAEAIAGATIIRYWIDVPLWLASLILMILLMATNLFSVASFGEFEYWFAGIKVAAIVVFLFLGTMFVFGLWPGKSMDFSNLWSHGGFLPNGPSALTVAMVTAIFSMVGAEIATIAAAESSDPEKAVTRAAKSVIVRISIFFVGSIFLLATILPWNAPETKSSPFVAAFTAMGIPYASDVMNAVALTAVLSCLNSGLYTSSRMLFVLAARREAPQQMVRVTRRGVPALAILASSVIGFLCVIAAAIAPDTVFVFLLNSIGAIYLIVYIVIIVSQIVLRRRTPDSELRVKMWYFPYLSILTAIVILAVLVQMFLEEKTRAQLLLSLGATGLVIALFFVNRWYVKLRPISASTVAGNPRRVLVMANQTVASTQLLDELRRIDREGTATYFVTVPANPVETGTAASYGPLDLRDATERAARKRLDYTMSTLSADGLSVSGTLGDFRPLQALADAVVSFQPDQIVIATLPADESTWQHFDVVDRARAAYGLPVTHIEATTAPNANSGA